MYKTTFRISVVLLLLAFSVKSFSQTERFDIITYTAPKDWKKDAKQGVVNYTNINAASGGFCVISLFASSASTGDPQQDFTREWESLVATPYTADPNPKTETQTTADGWKAVVGAAPVKLDGTDVYIILTVFSGFGKTFSVRSSLNDQSYTAQVDALLETMKFDKSKTGIVNNSTVPMQTNTGTGKFGLMSYSSPAGWTEQKFSDGVVFKPSGLPADEHLAMQIMLPLNATGTLEQALAQSFEEATVMYNGTSMYQADGKYGKKPPQQSYKGWNYIRGKGGIRVNNGTGYGTEVGLELFVVKVNNRFERVAILESRKPCGGVSMYYASDRLLYRNSIEEFLFSLRFSDLNTSILPNGSIRGGGITGVWQGTIQSTGAATGVRLEVFVPTFFTNGQVYFGPKFPDEGLDELNTRIPPELFPRNWGTYTYSNGTGVLKMLFADIPFRIEGGKLFVTKNQREWPFYKLTSVDGARFNGTYVMSMAYEKIPIISFTSDGRFTDKGAIKVLLHESNTCVNPAVVQGSGTYEVKDYTIHFNYSDGRKIKIAFLGTDYDKSNPSPATLRMSYNDDPMNRQ